MEINSELLKIRIIDWLYYVRGFYAAFTEFYNSSDVFGIKRSLFTREIEIKISRSDLRSELKTIEHIKNNIVDHRNNKYNKFDKHTNYLQGLETHKYSDFLNPNEFSFLIQRDLLEYATGYLENTPYGLITFREYGNSNSIIIEEEITPKKIHKKKFDLVKQKEVWRKTSMENQILRKRLLGLSL